PLHAEPTPGTSSMTPLQSLSMPSHTSAEGPTEPAHTRAPLWQVIAPAWHWPTQPASRPPGQLAAHAAPTSVGALSTAPSQSSSSPLHSSGFGPATCMHVSPFGPGPAAPVHA